MIYLDRAAFPIPSILSSEKVERARALVYEVLSTNSPEHLAQLRISLNSNIWQSVRSELHSFFRGKCAYCESLSTGNGPFDIEHFRPKEGAENILGKADHHYYSWLAYDWENMLIACIDCNRLRSRGGDGQPSGKGVRFPVEGERAPVLSSVAQCRAIETGTLIDPCYDNPEEHITFDDEGICKAISTRGKLTIELIGLNRQHLVQSRLHLIKQIKFLSKGLQESFSKRWSVDGANALITFASMMRADAAYSAAVRAVVKNELRVLAILAGHHSNHEAVASLTEFRNLHFPSVALPPGAAELDSETLHVLPESVGPKTSVRPGKYAGRQLLPVRSMDSLRRVEISNFKSIEHISFDIPKHSEALGYAASSLVLLGENSSGKSTALEAIALALLGTNYIKKMKLDGKRFLRRDESWNALGLEASVRIFFNSEQSAPVTLTIDPHSGEFSGEGETQVVLLGYGARRFFHERRATPSHGGPWSQLSTLFDPLATIRNPSRWLISCSQERYDAAVRALRQVLLLPDEAFVSRPKRPNKSGASVMVETQGIATPISGLSDGYRTIVATAIDIMHLMLKFWPNLERAQGVVLIDELETHLHPRWKMRILQRLRLAMPRVQFIITTHDPLCLRGALDGEVKVLRRASTGCIESVQDLPNVQGLTVEQILTSEFFGMLTTEDPTSEEEMIRYTSLVTNESRTSAEENELAEIRNRTIGKLKLGQTPQTQLVYESANEFILQHGANALEPRRKLSQDVLQSMVDIWASASSGESQS